MPALQIVSAKPRQGKSAVATGLAKGISASGAHVRLIRLAGDESADKDARNFGTYLFASSPGIPLDRSGLLVPPGETAVIELPAGAEPLPDIVAIVVVQGSPDEDAARMGRSLGKRLIGSIATNVAPGAIEDVARQMTNSDLRPLAMLPENRTLASPNVEDLRRVLGARTLYEGAAEDEVVEEVLIGPIYADPARPHFRRFASKAILAPYNKTDLLIAAIETQAVCVVITGGGEPSPYVLNRAQGENTTLLLAPEETPATVSALGEVWSGSRFTGQSKATAIAAALSERLNFQSLMAKLS